MKIAIGVSILFTALCGFIGGCVSYNYTLDRNSKIPLIFSELSQTKKNYAKEGKSVPPLTLYYSYINDISMKVFEANNEAYKRSMSHTTFAKELEFKMDPAFRVHAQISELADDFPNVYAGAIASISSMLKVKTEIDSISKVMIGVWDEDHDDHYYTEMYTTTDNKGNVSTHYRQVYDYTDHTFTCKKPEGYTALKSLNSLAAAYPEIDIEVIQPYIISTGVENEDAISGWASKDRVLVSSDEAFKKVMGNFDNTNVSYYRNDILRGYKELIDEQLTKYMSALLTTKSTAYTYRTNSSSHPGPKEYQVWKETYNQMRDVSTKIDMVTYPIQESYQMVRDLRCSIAQYIGVVLDGKDGKNPGDLRSEILNKSILLYSENYRNGFMIRYFGISFVILITVSSVVISGGLCGFVLWKLSV